MIYVVVRLLATGAAVDGKNALALGWKPIENSVNEEEFFKHIGTAVKVVGIQ